MPELKALETAFLNPTLQGIYIFWWRARGAQADAWKATPSLHSHGQPDLPARPPAHQETTGLTIPLGIRDHGPW